MKEWLLKTEDGKYHYYRDDMDCFPKHVEKIEIPEGSEIAIWFNDNDIYGYGVCFYRNDGKSCWTEKSPQWVNNSNWTMARLESGFCYLNGIKQEHKVLWKRQEVFIDESKDISGVVSDGGSSDYYFTKLPKHMIDQIVLSGGIEIKDIVRYCFSNDSDCKDIIKALKRIDGFKNGCGKHGVNPSYDANKILFFANELKKSIDNGDLNNE